jgi:hypothetical protein
VLDPADLLIEPRKPAQNQRTKKAYFSCATAAKAKVLGCIHVTCNAAPQATTEEAA